MNGMKAFRTMNSPRQNPPSRFAQPLLRALTTLALLIFFAAALVAGGPSRQTVLEIKDGKFFLNGRPTFAGRSWRGHNVEGLLPNARLVQGVFDDLNPDTRARWAYPDSGRWDPDRNTAEFVAAMPSWRRHGLLAFTLNLQGGSPLGYGNENWINTAFQEDGGLRPAYFSRLERILNQAR